MALNIPNNLIFPGSRLKLYFEETVRPNRTRSTVMIEGNEAGFLSLANVLMYFVNDLEDAIPIHEFPFVDAQCGLAIRRDYGEGWRRFGRLTRESERSFTWELTEDHTCLVASDVHSLGHLNPGVHMDDDFSENEISVYCVIG